MKIQKEKIIGVIIIIALLIAVAFIAYLYNVKNYQNTVQEMTFSEMDISKIPDGVYEGECNVNFIYAKVKVKVANGKIEDITLVEHKNERGTAAEVIVNTIVEEQKIDVDAVSGATNSSKVIKKAVENALSKGNK